MKVVINYQEYPHVELEKEMFRRAFGDVQVVESKTLDTAEFIKEADGADGVLVQFVAINRRVIDALTNCRGYVRYGIGYDNIDVEYAAQKGKMVANVQRYCVDEVSNHAVAMILALNRNLVKANRLIAEDKYEFGKIRPIFRLKDSTVGIIGIGNIGKAVADKLKPFVKRIIFYDSCVDAYPGCEKVRLEEVFSVADYVTLHLPLNPGTEKMINGQLLELMKPTAYLVNTARGGVIDQDTLIDRLKKRRFAGAGLDVYATEPLASDSSLRKLDNVILTHHSAWYSEGSIVELQRKGAEQLIQILKGQRPEFAVI